MNDPPPNLYFRGKRQIDAVWVSLILSSQATAIALYFFRVGNLRAIIVDFDANLILEPGFILFCLRKMRRLILLNDHAVRNYIHRAESLFNHHRIENKLLSLKDESEEFTF